MSAYGPSRTFLGMSAGALQESLKGLFSKLTKFVRDGNREPLRRPIVERLPSEKFANFVNRAISRQARDASFGTGQALFVFKPKRKFKLHVPVSLEVWGGHPEERDERMWGV